MKKNDGIIISFETVSDKAISLFFRSFKNPFKIITLPVNLLKLTLKSKKEKCESFCGCRDTLLKYSHVTCAYVGKPEFFDEIVHMVNVGSKEYERSLEHKVHFCLVECSTVKSEIEDHHLSIVKKQNIPIVYFCDEAKDFVLETFSSNDILITKDHIEFNALEKELGQGKVFLQNPIVDIKKYNPVNWYNNPVEELCIVGQGSCRKKKVALKDILAISEFSEIFKNYQGIKKYYVDFSDDIEKEKTKICRAVVCDSRLFDSEREYVKTALGLMAMGNLLIVDKKNVLNKYLSKDLMYFVGFYDGIGSFLENNKNLFYRERSSITLRRHIMNHYNQISVFEDLLDVVGIKKNKSEKISIIASTIRPNHIDQLFHNVSIQIYPNKELILVLHGDGFDIDEINKKVKELSYSVKIIERDAATIFGDNLNIAVNHVTGFYVTKMDDDDHYGPHHLNDLYLAKMYSRAMIVGKVGNFSYMKNNNVLIEFGTQAEERYWSHLAGGTILMETGHLRKFKFASISKSIDANLVCRIIANGYGAYSTHRYNYIRVRHGAHTYKKDENFFIDQNDRGQRKGLNKESCFV